MRPGEEQHLGILGPLMRAAVGDTMVVRVKNNLKFPINLVPGGVSHTAADAALIIAPGKLGTYTWTIPAQVRRNRS